jgi:hypothetical protein
MILNIRVAPKASRNLIKQEGSCLKIYLTKPALDGLANEQLIGLLAKHLGIKKHQIKITAGLKSKNKIVKIDEA